MVVLAKAVFFLKAARDQIVGRKLLLLFVVPAVSLISSESFPFFACHVLHTLAAKFTS